VSEPLDEAFLELQREYLVELPARLDELRGDVDAFRAGASSAAASLRVRFHRLAGSGGSYGFPRISEIAREMERWIATGPPASDAERLDAAVEQMEEVARHSRSQLGPWAFTEVPSARLRALAFIPAGVDRESLRQALHGAGFRLRIGDRREQPGDLPPEQRLDLLLIGLGPGEGDPSAIASQWTNDKETRPRAVVLIETLRAVDRLRAVAAGVDAVFPAERLLEDLPRYARTLARVGAPPSTILLAEPNAELAGAVGAALEQANIRVVRCHQGQAVQELLEREVPDLLLLAPRLVDVAGGLVARLVRQDPRFHLLPIVYLGPASTAEQIEALRAGADDYVPTPLDPELLLQTVVTRAERGRRLRELLHRDGLTGLLNHSTLLLELEYAVEHGRRHGGSVAFVVFDLDRFGEVNERFGQLVGDQVLLHVANVFRANVRASDVIGRFGGEEFGMILRGGGAEGATVLAAKLRTRLGEQAAATAEGVIIPLNVSVGWACYPGDGLTAGELAHAALRAMRREKGERE
jgi:diguanylate cyclase (GGDEF)-like protein